MKTNNYLTITRNIPQLFAVCFAILVSTGSLMGFGGNLDEKDPLKEGVKTTLSNYQKSQYKKDAARLALRMLANQKGNFENLEAEVPKDLQESIYESLIAVHQSGLPEAKVVTKKHKLHTFPTPTVDRMVVVYKRDAPWATPLRLGDDVTDSEEINALSKKFNLKIDHHVEWDEEHNSFNMRAKDALNIAKVAKDLSSVESIALVDMMEPNGDGNDIELKKIEGGWEINYVIKFDGCISGCKKRHSWTFEVKNGTVKFTGEAGDELPKWMK